MDSSDNSAESTILHPAVTFSGHDVHWVKNGDGDRALCGAPAYYAPDTRCRATCKRCISQEAGLVARGAVLSDEI